jgi:hypothetical protein
MVTQRLAMDLRACRPCSKKTAQPEPTQHFLFSLSFKDIMSLEDTINCCGWTDCHNSRHASQLEGDVKEDNYAEAAVK